MPIVQNRTTGQVPSYFFPPGALLRGFASGSSGDRVKPGDLDEAPLRLGPLSAASFASRNAFRRTVLARSAWRSAVYSDIALAPSVARSDFLNLASAALRSLSSVMTCSCNSSRHVQPAPAGGQALPRPDRATADRADSPALPVISRLYKQLNPIPTAVALSPG